MDYIYTAGEKAAVVIELGDIFWKCGFAGESSPRHVLHSKLHEYTAATIPLTVEKWQELLSPTLSTLYFRYLQVRPKDRRVLIVENLFTCSNLRRALARILFEFMKVPSIATIPGSFVGLLAVGSVHGLVIDIGWRETRICPISEQMLIFPAFRVSNFGVLKTLEHLRSSLERVLGRATATSETSSKNLACSVEALADIFAKSASTYHHFSDAKDLSLSLDDGSKVTVSREAVRSAIDELLEEGIDSISYMLLDSLLALPTDLRKPLSSSVLLMGGGAMIPGIWEKLNLAVANVLLAENRYTPLKACLLGANGSGAATTGAEQLSVHLGELQPIFPANMLAWVGGSLFSSLESFPQCSRTLSQYNESPDLPHWISSPSEAKKSGQNEEGMASRAAGGYSSLRGGLSRASSNRSVGALIRATGLSSRYTPAELSSLLSASTSSLVTKE